MHAKKSKDERSERRSHHNLVLPPISALLTGEDGHYEPHHFDEKDEKRQRLRRKSLDDLKQKRQHDYEELIAQMHLKVNLHHDDRQHQHQHQQQLKSQRLLPSLSAAPKLLLIENSLSQDDVLDNSAKKTLHQSTSCDHLSPIRKSFYTKFANANLMEQNKNSPTSIFNHKSKDLNLAPNSIIGKAIHSVEFNGRISLSHSVLGDDLAIALAQALEIMFVFAVDVSHNHISDKGVNAIINCLDPSLIRTLNLSSTKIKQKGVMSLEKLVTTSSNLTHLILDDTMLTDHSISSIANSLKTKYSPQQTTVKLHYSTLQVLSLSNNSFGDVAASSLAAVLSDCPALKELDLSMNSIRNRGGKALFDRLNDSRLEILDFGHNALAKNNAEAGCYDENNHQSDSAQSIADALQENKSLTHLSVAHSNFSSAECIKIGKGLESNFTLLGLHLEGNSISLNENGELVGGEISDTVAANQSRGGGEHHTVFTRIMNWCNPNITSDEQWGNNSKCWLCEKYNETCFQFDTSEEKVAANDEIKSCNLCLSFLHFMPEPMERKEGGGRFELWKMCPPIDIGYCFQVTFVDSIKTGSVVVHSDRQEKTLAINYNDNSVNKTDRKFELPQNVSKVIVKPRDASFEEKIRLLPRKRLEQEVEEQVVLNFEIESWTKNNSVFAGLKDNAKRVQLACWSDLTRSKVYKKGLEDMELLKALYLTHFDKLSSVFKLYSARFSSGDIFGIGANAYSIFLTEIKILKGGEGLEGIEGKEAVVKQGDVEEDPDLNNPGFDDSGQLLRKVDADLIFVTCSTRKNLSRVQFFDALLQLSQKKYAKTHSALECFEKFMKSHVTQNVTCEPLSQFRQLYLYNLEVDSVFKSRKEKLVNVFKRFSGREESPGERKLMSFGEFLDLTDVVGIGGGGDGDGGCDGDGDGDGNNNKELLTERAIKLCFVNAIELSENEDDFMSKHKSLSFCAFLEALARLAFVGGGGQLELHAYTHKLGAFLDSMVSKFLF